MGSEVEPYIAVDPRDPRHLVGVYQQDRWSDGGANGNVIVVSWDGGSSWTRSWAPLDRCTGGTGANDGDWERVSDPWVTIAPNGDVYQSALAFDASKAANSVVVSKSTDGGLTWGNAITLIEADSWTHIHDKESITADPQDSRYVYAVWDLAFSDLGSYKSSFSQPTYFSRTTNGGRTWEKAQIIYDPGNRRGTLANQIVVLPGGTLLDVFTLFEADSQHNVFKNQVAVLRSTNHGATWSAPIIVANQTPIGVYDYPTFNYFRTGADIPMVGVNPVTGATYVAWEDSLVGGDHLEHIALSTSTDDGLTWTTPMKVDATPFGTQSFTPTVAVAPDGSVAVTYYDFRSPRPDFSTLPTDYWMNVCHPAFVDCGDRANWVEVHLGGPFNILTAPDAYGLFLGDYEGLTATGPGTFAAIFAQTTGNPEGPTDVYVASVSWI